MFIRLSNKSMRLAFSLSVFLCFGGMTGYQAFGNVSFVSPESSEVTSDDGTVSLVWKESDAENLPSREYEVRRWTEGDPEEGVLVYQGSDTATFLSGLNEGVYELQVRSRMDSEPYPEWGDADLVLTVEYIDMKTVWILMSAGFVSFVALLAAIAIGSAKSNKDS